MRKRRIYRKSDLLREGFRKGLMRGRRVIAKILREFTEDTEQGIDSDANDVVWDFILDDGVCRAASRGCSLIGEDGEIVDLIQEFNRLFNWDEEDVMNCSGGDCTLTPEGKGFIRNQWRKFMLSKG